MDCIAHGAAELDTSEKLSPSLSSGETRGHYDNRGVEEKRKKKKNLPLGFPGGSAGKESPCNVGELGSTPGLGRLPEEGKGHPL